MVNFPPNVKEDINMGFVQIRHLRIIIPAVLFAAFLFVAWPGGFLSRVILFLLVAGGGLAFAVLEGPTRFRISRAYRRRPHERAPFREDKMEDWLAAVNVDQHGMIRHPDGSLSVVLEVLPSPWVLLSDEEQRQVGQMYQAATEQALLSKVELRWLLDLSADLPRQEFERQRVLARRAPGGLGEVILARALHHEALGRQGRALRTSAYLVLTARPDAKQNEHLRQAVADMEGALHQAQIGSRQLGPEVLRDLAWRQLCPVDHARSEPPVEVEWIRSPRTEEGDGFASRSAGPGLRIRL